MTSASPAPCVGDTPRPRGQDRCRGGLGRREERRIAATGGAAGLTFCSRSTAISNISRTSQDLSQRGGRRPRSEQLLTSPCLRPLMPAVLAAIAETQAAERSRKSGLNSAVVLSLILEPTRFREKIKRSGLIIVGGLASRCPAASKLGYGTREMRVRTSTSSAMLPCSRACLHQLW